MTLLLPLSSVQAIRQSGAIAALDFVISLPSLVALHLHIWDKRTLSGALWKGYAFSYIAWQLAYGFVLAPAVTPQNVVAAVIGMVLLAPLLIALFAYAFRKWEPRSL